MSREHRDWLDGFLGIAAPYGVTAVFNAVRSGKHPRMLISGPGGRYKEHPVPGSASRPSMRKRIGATDARRLLKEWGLDGRSHA